MPWHDYKTPRPQNTPIKDNNWATWFTIGTILLTILVGRMK